MINKFWDNFKSEEIFITDDYGNEMSYAEFAELTKFIIYKYKLNNLKQKKIIVSRKSDIYLVSIIYAIFLTRNIYIPVDINLPIDRKKYIFDNSEADFSILQSDIKFEKKEYENFDTLMNLEEDSAYIIYTSGTSGHPKGVEILFKSIDNEMKWITKEFSINNQDKILQRTSISFDASIWEILLPIYTNCKMHVLSSTNQKNPYRILETINDKNITLLQGVPTLLNILFSFEKKIKFLRIVFSGGEKLTNNLTNKIFSNTDIDYIVNLYGPTETCINITYYCVNRNDIHEHEIPIGQVIDNNYVYLLDDDLEEVGENQIGMIAIGGINLANCYIKDENLTNDKFIESERYGRLYLTGDLGILSGKGNFYFKGRLDRQVKLRGYRIELEEIESFVNSREYVSQSYIEVVENNNGFSNMRLYVDIDTKNKEILELELKDYFPPYMIPEISCVKGFQFNNSGKIDLLNTKVKDNIMDYIMKLKNLDYLDSQNFFELELDSLNFIELANFIKNKYGKNIDIIDFYTGIQTIDDCIQFMSEQDEE